MTDGLPEHIWISGGPGTFPYAHMPLSNPEDKELGTRYVRADVVEKLRAELSYLVRDIQTFLKAYDAYWHNTAGQCSPSAMYDYELILEDALTDAGRTLDKFREKTNEGSEKQSA